jgi:DNA-binding IclR family transcriptional regulator
MTSTKPTSKEVVVKTLASRNELTIAEIAAATRLGRSTVGKTLAVLERAGKAHRSPSGREGGRRLPDRWALGTRGDRAARRLRPGELDGLVLELFNSEKNDTPLGVAAVATDLGRSPGAVGNCLARLAAAGQLERVSKAPRRYRSATPPKKRSSGRRSRKDKS